MQDKVRQPIADARRVVVKLGTRAVSDATGRLDLKRLSLLVAVMAEAQAQGKELLVVSSGAVGLGAHQLGLSTPVQSLVDRQAAAAVGQSYLMAMYSEAFGRAGVKVGQVLVARSDFDDRPRYLNIRNTLVRLMGHKVVPIINENDAISVAELKLRDVKSPVFGDNDGLSAIVASKLGADLLVLLTDVAGLYERDPTRHPGAKVLHRVAQDWGGFEASGPGSNMGRGGMASKVAAAKVAVGSGCHTVIASGLDGSALGAVLAGEQVGTWFVAKAGMSARRRWVAWGTPIEGTFVLDDGAVAALKNRRASLLAAGVVSITGHFQRGAVVQLLDGNGVMVGRGMVNCDAAAAADWIAGRPPLAARNHDALITRDNLVLEEV
jgi:glutamate 5-kinase